jgi:hypothetical protein
MFDATIREITSLTNTNIFIPPCPHAGSNEIAWTIRDDVARVRPVSGMDILGGGRVPVKRGLSWI